MKARILEGGTFGGRYSAGWLAQNAEETINGSKVKDWETTDAIPEASLLCPKWENEEWVEGASVEEIDLHQAQLQRKEKAILRATMLEQGVTVLESGHTFHFTEAELQRFIVLKNEAEKGGLSGIEYINSDGEWIPLSIPQCTNIALIGMSIFMNIYKTTT